VVLFGILPFLFGLRGKSVSDGILVGTGIAIVWYTVETYYLRRESMRQTDALIHPLLIAGIDKIESRDTGRYEDTVVVRNVGKGPALYVEVEDVELAHPDLGQIVTRFQIIDVVPVGERVVVGAVTYFCGDGRTATELGGSIAHLNPSYANASYMMVIRCRDTNGAEHKSVVQMGVGRIRLVDHL